MLEMIKGCIVRKSNELCEQYQVKENGFTANVNASKIAIVMEDFINMQTLPMFLVLEVPLNAEKEKQLRKSNTVPFNSEVYYLDGLTKEQCLRILEDYKEILVNDGLVAFGFGVHGGLAEIMKYKYNEIKLWAKEPDDYKQLFVKNDIPLTEHCKTAWETFDENNPGDSFSVTVNDKNIYDVIKYLEILGLYLAEIR